MTTAVDLGCKAAKQTNKQVQFDKNWGRSVVHTDSQQSGFRASYPVWSNKNSMTVMGTTSEKLETVDKRTDTVFKTYIQFLVCSWNH